MKNKLALIMGLIAVALVYTISQFSTGRWDLLIPFLSLLVAFAVTTNEVMSK